MVLRTVARNVFTPKTRAQSSLEREDAIWKLNGEAAESDAAAAWGAPTPHRGAGKTGPAPGQRSEPRADNTRPGKTFKCLPVTVGRSNSNHCKALSASRQRAGTTRSVLESLLFLLRTRGVGDGTGKQTSKAGGIPVLCREAST